MMTKTQSPKQALAKYIFLLPIALLMLFVFSCQESITETEIIAQAKTPPPTTKIIEADKRADVYTIVEEMPRFPGCEESTEDRKKCAEQKMLQHIYTSLVYPKEARDAGIEGMVVVSFVVEKDGQITNPEILRSIGGGCDEEILQVVGNMPNWIPGQQAGKAVAVQFNLPVRFKLEK